MFISFSFLIILLYIFQFKYITKKIFNYKINKNSIIIDTLTFNKKDLLLGILYLYIFYLGIKAPYKSFDVFRFIDIIIILYFCVNIYIIFFNKCDYEITKLKLVYKKVLTNLKKRLENYICLIYKILLVFINLFKKIKYKLHFFSFKILYSITKQKKLLKLKYYDMFKSLC
ncbi:hypothetical protein STURON_00676 [Spiroplasma turonicum]|uniref:Uncharacterized protein n=1 Tax=Spiroplasma turonicum TaxID=216946 RepID=A0A0K1P7R1_9MOLU|nr:hypothetical protein STURON_00676 [Spiroplasma turonicum]